MNLFAQHYGVIVLSLSTLPALVGLGWVALGRFRWRRRDVWIPVGFAAVGFCLLALEYRVSDGSGDVGPIWVAAGASIGMALGWAFAARTPIPLPLRVVVGAATAITYTFLMGITLTPMLVFATPIVGLLLVVTPRRRRAAMTTVIA